MKCLEEFMAKQTTFETDGSMSESNKSITYEIPKLVNACMNRLNLNGILDSFKERGGSVE